MKLDALLNQNSSHYSLIVKSLVAISKTLNIPMCAKNIEDQETFQKLQDYGVSIFQGNYLSRETTLSQLISNSSQLA